MYVNYGCGFNAPPDWVNFDVSPTLRLERLPLLGRYISNKERFPENVRYGDIVKGLPVADGSANGVFASHVLEHLRRDEFCTALKNTFRMMSSGGIFRVIVPDLQSLIQTYIDRVSAGKQDANDLFLRSSHLGCEHAPQTLIGHLRHTFGRTDQHYWMWDWPSIRTRLQETGFVGVRKCTYRDCSDPAFASVEAEERFAWSVAAEAIKP